MRMMAMMTGVMLTVSSAHAATLSAPDREALLENLEKLRDAATTKVDAKFRMAIAAYHAAMVSDDAAMELYLKCIEKVNFLEQQKKVSDFNEWKRQDDVRANLADTAFRMALRCQLRWLVLTLQAASDKANLKALAGEAQEVVDSIFNEAEKFAGQEKVLGQGVVSTVFARAYEIGEIKKENWPSNPVDLGNIYGTVVFPPLRTPTRVDALRTAWIKRIHQEAIKAEFWTGKEGGNGNGNGNGRGGKGKGDKERRIGMASDMKGVEYEKFILEMQPELQWQMEVDLFRSGDEGGAALRMLEHLRKHIDHKSARKWGEEFRNLLKPKDPLAPAGSAAP